MQITSLKVSTYTFRMVSIKALHFFAGVVQPPYATREEVFIVMKNSVNKTKVNGKPENSGYKPIATCYLL